MITRETVDKLRADRAALLRQAEQLESRAEGDADVARAAADLRERLRTYTGLVDAVLDAVSMDRPPPPL